jgi:SAM-dependent methyltransferase
VPGYLRCVIFDVSADAYGQFIGLYSEPLAAQFADLAGARPGQRALDVGCGPGALTATLAARLGARAVCAVEPSEQFVTAVRERLPGVDVRMSPAEQLPFTDAVFDVVAAQLVVQFMADPVAGLREMGRVTRSGGIVAACVWDRQRAPMAAFWSAARELDPGAPDGSDRPGARAGQLAEFFAQAGLGDASGTELTVQIRHPTFEHWWERFTLGVGPTGAYVASLAAEQFDALRELCRSQFPDGPVDVSATAWAVTCRRTGGGTDRARRL